MDKAKKILEQTGISVQQSGSSVSASGTAFGFFKAYEATMYNEKGSIYAFLHDPERTAFCGGSEKTVQDAINGTFDTAPFLKARAALAGKLTKVATMDALKAPKRKRIMSEYDGELDFDRLYEIQPFYSTVRENSGAVKAVDLLVHFNFRGSVEAEEIAQFGTMTWAVADLLERAGIQCSITLQYHTTPEEHMNTIDVKDKTVMARIKEAGQYIDPLNLARCFTPWFYRKCIWNVSALAAEYVGNTLLDTIGRSFTHHSSASAGKIELAMDIMDVSKRSFDTLERYIKQALLAE